MKTQPKPPNTVEASTTEHNGHPTTATQRRPHQSTHLEEADKDIKGSAYSSSRPFK
eukprot:m.232878 g.232878  ORF g.232878 m.232878 type:complete len:56 (-) comp17078_c6_seq3:415-582(-)